MKPAVFGFSGLRGRVGLDLTPELITGVTRAFGFHLGAGRVAVGRDTRVSGPSLAAAAAAGLTSAGCDVVDAGVCPTPTLLHYTRTAGLRGGIVVTASHNPEEWNGLKFCGPDGRFLSPDELARFRPLALDPPGPVGWDRSGSLTAADAVAGHVAAIAGEELFRAAGRGSLRIGMDAVNGAAAEAGPALARALGLEPVLLNCATDAESLRRGFPRPPEPTPGHLADLAVLVRRERLDFGIGFDPDGDRAGLVDETGTPLPEEWTLCLACRFVLARFPGPVVTNLSTTRAVEDVAAEFGVPVFRTPVGEVQVSAGMERHGAAIGGEGNGGVILPRVNFTRDGLVALACIAGLIRTSGRPLSQLAAGLGDWRMVKTKLDLDADRFVRRAGALRTLFPGAKLDESDGLRLEGEDFWLHARPSNTEPLVRVIAEARDRAPDPEIERARRALTGKEQ
ncbi:MAG TPA: phosphoglucosamine mutase [candidate division WOR-3 bacterium]|uniref:Phosphoglucosamine mutase n=1 Tax=candidate division WOR-3 bacterium TaxID=2052148 RepID=A0A7V0XET5_UNCW3|nr:phosphoglucosamine mutase [candidate division WOR-3 bacterium]